MAFKRACRVGETISIPLLSDPAFDANAAGIIAAETEAAAPADVDAFMSEMAKRIISEAVIFANTFDESVLSTPLTDVTRATIRGLSGAQIAAAETAGHAAAVAAKCGEEHMQAYTQTEVIRLGLVSLGGFDAAPVAGLYPVELLMGAGGIGSAWRNVRRELAGRITDWSHLGKPESSSSEP